MLDDLPTGDARRDEIVATLEDAFADLIAQDARAFVKKFRKMAADPFSFYRGSACVFYADVARLQDEWADERTGRVWIQGDLHAENYGTHMDAEGILVFDVNDFDEAYLGHFTWDLQRMAASLALLGFAKALSDRAIEQLVTEYGNAYLTRVKAFVAGELDNDFRLTLDTTDGAVRDVLLAARNGTRIEQLRRSVALVDHEPTFAAGPGVRRLEDDERERVMEAYGRYLETIPEGKRQQSVSYRVKDVVGRSGFGIGSAGLPAYNLLVEGRTQALENDVVLSMKQGNVPAPSRVVTDEEIASHFEHHGHRTAVSQRALQAHADPWLGWCELDDTGWLVRELSPYEADLDWSGLSELDEMLPLVRALGEATAKVHCVSDEDSDESLVTFQTEEAIMAVVGGREDEFVAHLVAFGAAYGAKAREDYSLFVDAFRNGAIKGLPVD